MVNPNNTQSQALVYKMRAVHKRTNEAIEQLKKEGESELLDRLIQAEKRQREFLNAVSRLETNAGSPEDLIRAYKNIMRLS